MSSRMVLTSLALIAVLVFSLLVLPVGQSQGAGPVLYLRASDATVNCPVAGNDRLLSETQGSALNVFPIGQIPNLSHQREESAGTIAAGDWVVKAWISVANKGPQETDVTARVRIYNPNCTSIKQFVVTQTVTLPKGFLGEVTFTQNVGEVTVAEGDVILVVFADTDGHSRPIASLRYGSTPQLQADSRLILP